MEVSTAYQLNGQPAFQLIHKKIGQGYAASNYLFTGKLGLAFYYFSLYEAFGDEDYSDQCITLLEEVLEEEGGEDSLLHGAGLAAGKAGLGYLLTIATKKGIADMNLSEELAEIDDFIFGEAMRQMEDDHHDYLHGAMSAVFYFLQRPDEDNVRLKLEQLAAALDRKAIAGEEGSWFPNYIIDKTETDRIDLSISHGNAGFILLFIKMMEAGIAVNGMKKLIGGGIRFILAQRFNAEQEKKYQSLYPFFVNRGDRSVVFANERLAWCYGDTGVAWLLYRAGAALNVDEWKETADEILESTFKRKDPASTMNVDSHFCHGSAGLAYFYRVLYQFTGNEKCKQAAAHWIDETLRYLGSELPRNYYEGRETDLLNGLPGINLVLLSFEQNKDLTWKELFLL